jgi:hypothetical protein
LKAHDAPETKRRNDNVQLKEPGREEHREVLRVRMRNLFLRVPEGRLQL